MSISVYVSLCLSLFDWMSPSVRYSFYHLLCLSIYVKVCFCCPSQCLPIPYPCLLSFSVYVFLSDYSLFCRYFSLLFNLSLPFVFLSHSFSRSPLLLHVILWQPHLDRLYPVLAVPNHFQHPSKGPISNR